MTALLFERRIDGDTQIKLPEIRIEFQEIKSTIIQTSGGVVHNAVASVCDDPQFLVSHVELPKDIPPAERRALLERLD